MKGIILAGGHGTRLRPATTVVSKHLLPVYDKPMIYYPLSTLMLAGIREVLVISTPRDTPHYKALLGDGASLGIRLRYAVQDHPGGLPEALLIGRDQVDDDGVALVLGDNIFHAAGLTGLLQEAKANNPGATVFGCQVPDASRYGVAHLEGDRVVSLEEKPTAPRSNWAVTGLYFYDKDAATRATRLRPSARGELEITDLNRSYLEDGKLRMLRLPRGSAWLDAGTPEALLEASNFIAALQHRQGIRIAHLAEVAWRMGFIPDDALRTAAERHDGDVTYAASLLAGR